jgi:AbrB family looped-hinge helix DNA binding protein
MCIATSKIGSKGQTTIPTEVRARLGRNPGDIVIYEDTRFGIVIRKSSVPDIAFLRFQACLERLIVTAGGRSLS